MTDQALALSTNQTARGLLLPADASSSAKSRITAYLRWLEPRPWYEVDFAGYRDHLLGRLSPKSAVAHLSTLRARFREVLKQGETRDMLYTMAQQQIERGDMVDSFAERAAFVNEFVVRIENALDPKCAAVKVTTVQDAPDNRHLRLSKAQCGALLSAPGSDTPLAIRDTALIALMLCTGAREGEIVSLDVDDLRQKKEDTLSLHVRNGKGCKERMVPYGELSWCLALVDRWLKLAGIESGAVFRSLWKSHKCRPGRLSRRQLQTVVKSYQIMIDGAPRSVRPHDLRRTYARRLYDAGVDIRVIQLNLGHSDAKTTWLYIGDLKFDERRPPDVFGWNWQAWASDGLHKF